MQEDEILQSLNTLADQVKRLAQHQLTLAHQITTDRQQSAMPRSLHNSHLNVVHFPSPSIVDMAVVESPFVFPSASSNSTARQEPKQSNEVNRFKYRHHI